MGEGDRGRPGAVEAGKIVGIYKVSGQRRVLAVADVDSPDELVQIIIGQLPIARNLEIAEVFPVRE
ncbi:MAG TPA: muconolactone Delta-isomerase family protein [Rubrobacteraceae bacterium]|nr:muconolactone Delta-isomerase family protein [Rubrobacteraceae bacterium]